MKKISKERIDDLYLIAIAYLIKYRAFQKAKYTYSELFENRDGSEAHEDQCLAQQLYAEEMGLA